MTNSKPNDKEVEGWEKEFPETRLTLLMTYGFPRAVGHTFTEINGIKNNPDSILIVTNLSQARQIDLPLHQCMTIDRIPDGLRGLQKAILIDHHALNILVHEHNEQVKSFIRSLLAQKQSTGMTEEAVAQVLFEAKLEMERKKEFHSDIIRYAQAKAVVSRFSVKVVDRNKLEGIIVDWIFAENMNRPYKCERRLADALLTELEGRGE